MPEVEKSKGGVPAGFPLSHVRFILPCRPLFTHGWRKSNPPPKSDRANALLGKQATNEPGSALGLCSEFLANFDASIAILMSLAVDSLITLPAPPVVSCNPLS
jgi:hypothetical protein